jgi:hypothetical protein
VARDEYVAVADAGMELRRQINDNLALRLAALDAEEYRGSECVLAADRVLPESALWLGVAALLAAATLALWL